MNDTPTPRTDSLVNVLAGWEDRNGAMAAITPDEWDDLFYPVTQACITQSPRQLRRDLAAAQEELARVKAEREATLELLAELHAMVKGECPSLLNEDIGGDARTALAIEEMLSKRDAAIAAKGDK